MDFLAHLQGKWQLSARLRLRTRAQEFPEDIAGGGTPDSTGLHNHWDKGNIIAGALVRRVTETALEVFICCCGVACLLGRPQQHIISVNRSARKIKRVWAPASEGAQEHVSRATQILIGVISVRQQQVFGLNLRV